MSLKKIAFLFAPFLLAGCIYTDIAIPLDNDLNQTQLGTKTGKASSYGLLWLVAWGDAGTRAAAENGQLSTVNHSDREFYSILLGAYTRVTTVVYGD